MVSTSENCKPELIYIYRSRFNCSSREGSWKGERMISGKENFSCKEKLKRLVIYLIKRNK